MRDALLVELDHEMAKTRLVLSRVPDAAFAWRPHEKSYTLGGLATHLARLPHWGAQILDQDAYDLDAAGARPADPAARPPDQASCAAVLDLFDRHVAEVRTSLLAKSDAELQTIWSLKRGTHTLLTMPRIEALRSFLLHHLIHHRGQMTVYLRLQDVPLPPLYGPTADDEP